MVFFVDRQGRQGTWEAFKPTEAHDLAEALNLVLEQGLRPDRGCALQEFSAKGVRAAADECADRYLLQTIEASPALVIVALGKIAEDHMRSRVKFDGVSPVMIGGRARVVATLPHPNARKVRSCEQCLSKQDLDVLRSRLACL